ncbi:MAG: hypothetical protein LIO91_08820 [Bacteroidales bacterium]|nr:hypothetical protein [Bacteroidales bacterium]
MIQEQYVTFETAELLKAAGFPQENGGVTKYYLPDGTLFSYQYADYSQDIAAPTHAQAMRWLREEKHIAVSPYWIRTKTQWQFWGSAVHHLENPNPVRILGRKSPPTDASPAPRWTSTRAVKTI